jgi:hypothetical protein
MPLQIEINGTVVPASSFYAMTPWTIPDAAPAYPSEPIILRNTGGAPITITSIARPSTWGRNVAIESFPDTPFEIPAGGTAEGIVRVTRRGPLDTEFVPGTPFTRLTVSYDDTSMFVDIAARVQRQTPLTGYTFPDFDAFRKFWVLDAWSISAAAPEANPLKLGWGIWEIGHMAFADNHLSVTLNAGHRGIFLWQPWGASHVLDDEDPGEIQFDGYVEAQDYGALTGNNNAWAQWEQFLDYVYSFPDAEVYVYNGNCKTDPDFVDPINSADPAAFFSRGIRSVQHMFRRQRLHHCCDSPNSGVPWPPEGTVNPVIQPGEPRFELYEMTRKLLARRGGRSYREPRARLDQPWWHGPEWNLIIQDVLYTRSNSAWYSDSSHLAGDELCGTIARWVINGSVELLPYQIADTLIRGHQVAIGVNKWFRDGRTLQQLYDATKALMDFGQGHGEA